MPVRVRDRKLPTPATVIVDGKRYDWPVHTEKPWLVEIWEPLQTKAPNPSIAQPYCCYINTVIFYLRPYIRRPWSTLYRSNGRLCVDKPKGMRFEQWDEIETIVFWHSALEINGQRFEPLGGTVTWKRKRWWMRRWARRKANAA